MKVNKDTMAKLRRLYYNLTGEEVVFDDYCFFNMWYSGCNFIETFWLLKKAIDNMLAQGMTPFYNLVKYDTHEVVPFETVNGYYHF